MTYPPHPYTQHAQPAQPRAQRRDRRRILQLIAGIAAFLIAHFIGIPVAAVLLGLSGSPHSGADYFVGEDPLWVGFVVACAVALCALILYRLIVRFIAADPGQGLRGGSKTVEFLFGITVGVAVAGLTVGVLAALGVYRVSGFDLSGRGVLIGLNLSIAAAFAEELLFRGILLRVLDAWLGSWAALLLTAVLFGFAHFANPGAGWWGAVAISIEAGLMLGAAYLLTRRLWLPIGIHLTWNFLTGGVLTSEVSGIDTGSSLLVSRLQGPDWLTGGALGIEGSVITVIVCSLATAGMLYLAHRQGQLLPSVRTERRRAAAR